ncbi:MAG: hypothetical protein GY950_34160, partial [bacterium]|nr:hypothetical protein [bacterium]
QWIVIYFKSPREIIQGLFKDSYILDFMPPAFFYFLDHMMHFSIVSVVVSLVTFIAAIAFLKRRNWARIYFAVFMIVTAGSGFVGIIFHDAFMMTMPPGGDVNMLPMLESMNKMMNIFILVMGLMILVFHAWLANKLLSKDLKAEFTPNH